MGNVATRAVTDVDVRIGRNVEALRILQGYTQGDLADVLGVSFQQFQKYEKGQNRISAGRLYLLKEFFDVPYDAFFHGLPSHGQEEGKGLLEDIDAWAVFYLVERVGDESLKKAIRRIVSIVAAL